MVFDGRAGNVLIVSTSEKFNTMLSEMLPEVTCKCVTSSISDAKRAALEQPYDLVVINAPLPDDSGTRFAIDCCDGGNASVLLIVRNELYAEISDSVTDHGVFTLPKPISAQMLRLALDWMRAARERIRRLERKSVSLEDKMAEIRIVSRAKWLLIDSLRMTEPDAHRFIEKQAMDRCVSRREIAENIIKTYS